MHVQLPPSDTLRFSPCACRQRAAGKPKTLNPEPPGAGPGVDEGLLQPVTSKRFLDLLINLARFKPRVARELPALSVPMPAEQVHTLPSVPTIRSWHPMQPADAWEEGSGVARRDDRGHVLSIRIEWTLPAYARSAC